MAASFAPGLALELVQLPFGAASSPDDPR